MSSTDLTKHYQKGDFTIVWKPKLCIHSGVCVQRLPEVYHPNDKPWITPENASVKALKEQIEACPSGALTYFMKDEEDTDSNTSESTKVEIISNVPLMVHGTITLTGVDGQTEEKKRSTAFCRCGASTNKPFCDGSHNDIDFQG